MTTANQMAVQNFDPSMLIPVFAKVLRQVQNPYAREEIQSEATVRILSGIAQGVVRGKLFSYAYRVAHHTMIDYLRYNNRMIAEATTLVNYCDGVEDDVGGTVEYFYKDVEEEEYAASTTLIAIRQSYESNKNRFTPAMRKVVEYKLYVAEGLNMTHAELAEAVGIDRSRATKALRMLQEVYRD